MWELHKDLWLLENCSKDTSVRVAVLVWRPAEWVASILCPWRAFEEMENQGASLGLGWW